MKPEQKVTHITPARIRKGIITRISDDKDFAFVVFDCKDWSKYKEKRAMQVRVKELSAGWD